LAVRNARPVLDGAAPLADAPAARPLRPASVAGRVMAKSNCDIIVQVGQESREIDLNGYQTGNKTLAKALVSFRSTVSALSSPYPRHGRWD
jgi:hypothetical protein